jgi:mitochondrial fission protein ELM1
MGLPQRPVPQMWDRPARALSGASLWIISDGKAGHEALSVGVASALGLEPRIIKIHPRWPWHWLAPRGPVPPAERFARPGSRFAPPWPDVALAAGRLTVPYLRAMRRAAGPECLCVALMDPRIGDTVADLIWVPEHDARRGNNVIVTLTSPHRFSPSVLAALRNDLPASVLGLPAPRVAVLLGGPSAAFGFSSQACQRLCASLKQLAQLGVSFMITPSRRTPPGLLARVDEATRAAPRLLWQGTGDNPYPAFLAGADLFIVTADSVNMTGEAAATGKPVYVFMPDGGAPKFHRFHAALAEHGATRPLPEQFAGLELWSYPPLDAAQQIAAEIRKRQRARLARRGHINSD